MALHKIKFNKVNPAREGNKPVGSTLLEVKWQATPRGVLVNDVDECRLTDSWQL